MPLPAREGTTLSRCGGMPGRGPRTHSRAHAHSRPRLRPAPAFHPPRRGGRRTHRPGGREQPAGRRRMAPNCHPPARPGPAPPSPAAPRPACTASPLARPAFPARPLTGFPGHGPPGSLKAEGPRDRGGKPPTSMTRWVSSSPHSLRHRPRKPSPMAILLPDAMHSRTKVVNFSIPSP